MIMTRLKHFLYILIALFAMYCLVETGAFLVLRSVTTVKETDWGVTEELTSHFPAQVRMTRQEILKEFPSISPLQRAGQFLSFGFDPVMGYRGDDFLRWYGGTKADVKDKFVMACFGGSTTQLDNWPKYLIKYAKKRGVDQDLLVLNCGLSGYMTFTEKLYFSNWILPMLQKAGKNPDLVLSMDGVNDVWFRVFGYDLAQREDAPIWFDRYHGYHQLHDQDMKNIKTLSGSVRQLMANAASDLRVGAILFAPYTMRLMEYGARRVLGRDASEPVDAISYETMQLPGEVEESIVTAWKDSLLDFYGLAAVRDIPFVGYLQPVALEAYYPHPMPEEFPFKGIDWMGVKEHRAIGAFTRLSVNRLVDTSRMYGMAEQSYADLSARYPGHFTSLINLFRDIPDAGSLYSNDAIHYGPLGKEVMAEAVIDDLIAKGLLTVAPGSGGGS